MTKVDWYDIIRGKGEASPTLHYFLLHLKKMSIKLWLDDVRNPDDPGIQEDFGAFAGMVWVKNVAEAKKLLSAGNVSYISFDNDLGCIEEGKDLAKWIEEEAFLNKLPKLIWTVHSHNMEGRRHIIMAMRNADRFWGDGV